MGAPKPQSAGFYAGFYQELERLLLEQLARAPQDRELRLKLLELYCETGRAGEFRRERETLGAAGTDDPAVHERIERMTRMLGLGGSALAAEPAAPAGTGPRPAAAHRRIGDDGRYREPFAALAQACDSMCRERGFHEFLDRSLQRLALRPSPLQDTPRLSEAVGGARILLKREDLAPADARLRIAVAGQAALAQRLGRGTLVTWTASGARGAVTAEIGARLGLRVQVFMDRDDLDRHKAAAFRLRLLGAELRAVSRRDLPNRDIRHAALDHWAQRQAECFPVMGLDAAPPPYDLLAREIPSAVGREVRAQALAQAASVPALVVARGGERADAIGLFEPFLGERGVRLVCVQPSRELGIRKRDELLGPASGPAPETLRRLAQAELAAREHAPVHREHGFLRASGRLEYVSATPDAARKAVTDLAALEGVVLSLETAHAVGWACAEAARLRPDQCVVAMVAEGPEADLPELARILEGVL